MRPGPQFQSELMANALRQQSALGEQVRRVAGSGDLIPWASPLKGSVSDPAVFSGLAGHYVRFNDFVYATFKVSYAGVGTGSGFYILPLPVKPWASSYGIRGRWRASQGGQEIDGNVVIENTGTAVMYYRTSALPAAPGLVSNTQPFTWAAGAVIDGWIEYLAAASS